MSVGDKTLAWRKLGAVRQWRIVDRLVKRERRRLADADWLASISSGLRTFERINRVVNTPCVVYTVFKKYQQVPKDRPTLPPVLTARVKHRGRFYAVAVPTDIQSLEKGGEQSLNRIVARPGSGNRAGLRGAATAVVEDDSLGLFVMGCHHVIAYSSKTPQGRGLVNVVIRKDGRNFGIRYLNADFPNFGGFGIDAALALVDPASRSWVRRNILRGRIAGVRKQRRVYPVAMPVKVLTPRGMLRGKIISDAHAATLPYSGGAYQVRFEEVYKLKVNRPGPTLPGDSGSPVLDRDNRLIGMHFWGVPQRFVSYMMPAYLLFRQTTFGRVLRLAD